MLRPVFRCVIFILAATLLAAAQTSTEVPYQPKFPGDPAHSNAEAAALGYMRTVVNAQRLFKKKNGQFAGSLSQLVGQGSFTRRMTRTEQGDYTAKFQGNGQEYSLQMTPRQYDAEHRSFYVNDTGVIRGEEGQPATVASAPVKKG